MDGDMLHLVETEVRSTLVDKQLESVNVTLTTGAHMCTVGLK